MESDLNPKFMFLSCNTLSPASIPPKPGNNTIHHIIYWPSRIITNEDDDSCKCDVDLLNTGKQKFIAAIWNFHLFYSQIKNIPKWQDIRAFENKWTPPLRTKLHLSVKVREKFMTITCLWGFFCIFLYH